MRRPEDRDSATRLAIRNVAAISLFMLLVDLYFVVLLNWHVHAH
jgi:hypothetical protein